MCKKEAADFQDSDQLLRPQATLLVRETCFFRKSMRTYNSKLQWVAAHTQAIVLHVEAIQRIVDSTIALANGSGLPDTLAPIDMEN